MVAKCACDGAVARLDEVRRVEALGLFEVPGGVP